MKDKITRRIDWRINYNHEWTICEYIMKKYLKFNPKSQPSEPKYYKQFNIDHIIKKKLLIG